MPSVTIGADLRKVLRVLVHEGVMIDRVHLGAEGTLYRINTPHCYNDHRTWMGDRLRAGKPSRYVTSHLGQLSLPSLRGR